MSPSKKAGIRPQVWIPAALVIALAVGMMAATVVPFVGGSPEPAVLSPLVRLPAPSASPSAVASEPPPPAPAAQPVPVAGSPAPRASAGAPAAAREEVSRGSSPSHTARRARPEDPELARRLYVAEADAARQAIGLGLVTPAQLDAAAGASAPSAGEASAAGESAGPDAERRTASDALLQEYLLRKQYQAATYPEGFPAEKNMRSVVRSRIGNLGDQDRLTLLNDALQEMASLPQQPRFYTTPFLSSAASGG